MIKKNLLYYTLIILILFSCNNRKIVKGVILVYKKETVDSAVIRDGKKLDILNNFFKTKKEVNYKFPGEYQIKLYYSNGEFEEFYGLDTILRANYIFTSGNEKYRNNYFKLIDSVCKGLKSKYAP